MAVCGRIKGAFGLFFIFQTLIFLGCGSDSVGNLWSNTSDGERVTPYQAESPDKKEWTVMVYMDGDNDLEPFAIDAFNLMERVGSDSNINIIVLFDRIDDYDASNGDWAGTRLYYVEPDGFPDTINSTLLREAGELNMAEAQTLEDFIARSVISYPANRYLLVIWDHGFGWGGTSQDETSDYDILNFQETEAAINGALTRTGLDSLDLVAFSACAQQQAANVYFMKDYTEYMVAKQAKGYISLPKVPGLAYENWLRPLALDPLMSTAELGRIISDTYVEYHKSPDILTISTLDMAAVDRVAEGADSMAGQLSLAKTDYPGEICNAWRSVQRFGSVAVMDLYHFASLLLSSDIPPQMLTGAESTMRAIDEAVLYNRSFIPDANGLSIYFPPADFYMEDYNRHRFAEDTRWDEFVSSTDCSKVWYVDDDAAGDGSGESWNNAFTRIQLATDAAITGDEIWVAEGVYTPVKNKPVVSMNKGVYVYGGFEGNETKLSERGNPFEYPSVLDGEGRSFHVVDGASNARLDGFIVKNGDARISYSYANKGAGLLNVRGRRLEVANCAFFNNRASAQSWTSLGGAVYNEKGIMKISNCYFLGNSAYQSGSAIYGYRSGTIIENSVFAGNGVSREGAALADIKGEVEVTNCTFNGNLAENRGNAVYAENSEVSVRNSILWEGCSSAAAEIEGTGDIKVAYSDITGGYGGSGNIDAPPLFVNAPIFWDRTVADGADNTIKVNDASLYKVGDVIELEGDGTARTVTAITGGDTVEFSPALPAATTSRMTVENWGAGAVDLTEDYRLAPDSPCINAGDPAAEYDDPDGSRNDMGAYGGPEAPPYSLR